MSWHRTDTRATPAEGLEVEIDPALIEAALQAVDRRMGRPAGAPEDELVVPPEMASLVDPPLDSGRSGGRSAGSTSAASSGSAGARRGVAPPLPLGEAGPDPRLLAELRLREARIAALSREVSELRAARDTAEAAIQELRAASSELYSDLERLRARSRKDREDAERIAEERVLEHLMETADNLDRALASPGAEGNPLARGLRMVLDQLTRRMRAIGLERLVASPGDAFDPQIHDAMQRVEMPGLPAGSIAGIIGGGFRYRGRLVRPVRVAVVHAPASEPSADEIG